MPLSKLQETITKKASPPAVEKFFRDLLPNFANKQWLSSTNRYLHDIVGALTTDATAAHVVDQDLGEYIAASAPVHCVDGWSYWGKALDSHCRGDVDSARHLAYYASLRGAMSLLATQGIGIFDHHHFVVRANKTCELVPGTGKKKDRYPGTHEVSWYVLDYWPKLPGSDKLLLEVIRPQGIPLERWVDEFHKSATLPAVVTADWLKTWGFDLKRFASDRKSRNHSSYRPTQYPARTQMRSDELSAFACDAWRVLEPAASRFKPLDDHLLRLALHSAFRLRTGDSHLTNVAGFQADVGRTVDALASPGADATRLKEFLIGNIEPQTATILVESAKKDPVSHPKQHLQMISRAAMLLRLASGFVERLLLQSGVPKNDLAFWVNDFIVNRGLWTDPLDPPNPLTDLWIDIDVALTEEDAWRTAHAAAPPPIYDWRLNRTDAIARLGEGERVASWCWGL